MAQAAVSLMRVLVTGHCGYIGSVMTAMLRHARYEVAGLDCNLYNSSEFGRVGYESPGFDIDLRDLDFTDLLPFDAVVHLAAVPADPEHGIQPGVAEEINLDATLRLAHCCRQAGVRRFLFASTYRVYACIGNGLCHEGAPLEPQDRDAELKLACERALTAMTDTTFTPVVLRHADVYGVSPRMRTDLLVNDLAASAATCGVIPTRSDAARFRPLIHIEDVARAYIALLGAGDDAIRGEVFNLARTSENYRVAEIADAVAEVYPYVTRGPLEVTDRPCGARVSGAKLAVACPRLSFGWTLARGVRQLHDALRSAGVTRGDWRSDKYRRALHLRRLIEAGTLDARLHAAVPA